VLEAISEAKISDDDVSMLVQEQVLKLEIPMDNFLLVDVPDARDELGEEFCGIAFSQVAMGEDVVEKFATGCIF
jgi:hypothetical protein